MDIKALAKQHEAFIIERRRFYHSCPELSGEEVNTRASLKADLEAMGIETQLCTTCNGLVGIIRGGKPGKTVALRADIDALPIREETGLPFASTNGCMHACGHDNHMAMLLGAAKILMDIREELCGTVKLILQPAEETAAGARQMLEEGVLDDVDAIYGIHIWGDFDAPLMDFSSGNRMACCDFFKITVDGVSAHGSAPHLGVDAIVAASAVVMNLQSFVSRSNDPLNPLVLTIGSISGGSRWNVIPNHVEMEGTVRTFSRKVLETVAEDVQRIAGSTAAAFGATATVEYKHLAMPVINDNEQLNQIARNAVIKLYGEEGLGHLPTLMGSEDFSYFGERCPYIYGFLGSRCPEKGYIYTNHQERYDVDEGTLSRGSAVAAQFAHDFLLAE